MPAVSSTIDDNHYAALGLKLPKHGSVVSFSKEELKAAYHRSLLLHHPDKSVATSIRPIGNDKFRTNGAKYTVDQIMKAYETLSDPVLKSAYDKSLFTAHPNSAELNSKSGLVSHLGVETFDLEDLVYNDGSQTWSHNCRCGNSDGFVLSEADLEEASLEGEIWVECKGCSLVIKVVFGVGSEGDS